MTKLESIYTISDFREGFANIATVYGGYYLTVANNNYSDFYLMGYVSGAEWSADLYAVVKSQMIIQLENVM